MAAVAAYDTAGYTVVPAVLPALRARAHTSPLVASLIFAGFSLGMIGGFALGGVAVKRQGPRSAALVGVSLHFLADLLFISGHSAWVYLAARVVQGVGSGAVWMACVFAVLIMWPDRPGLWLGRVLTSFAIASVIGPLVAALGGPVRPFLADAALVLVGMPAALRFPSEHSRAFGWQRGVLRSRQFLFALSMIGLVALVISVLDGSYTLHFATKLSQTGLAVLFATSSIAYGVGALLPVASGSPRQSRISAQVGAVCCAAILAGVTLEDSVAWWFALLVLLGLALGATEAGVLALASRVAERGLLTAMLVYSQAFAVGYLIGPPVATWVTTRFSLLSSALLVGALLVVASAGGLLVPGTRESPLVDSA